MQLQKNQQTGQLENGGGGTKVWRPGKGSQKPPRNPYKKPEPEKQTQNAGQSPRVSAEISRKENCSGRAPLENQWLTPPPQIKQQVQQLAHRMGVKKDSRRDLNMAPADEEWFQRNAGRINHYIGHR